MFLDELTPLLQELAQHPVAFLGGVFSGGLRLDLAEDPLKSWLEKQGARIDPNASSERNGGKNKPQSIEIE